MKKLAELAKKKRHLYLIEKMHSGKPLSTKEINELEDLEADPLDPTVVRTFEEVGKVMGVSYRTVQRWKRDGLPTTKEGFFDLDEVRKWHARRNEVKLTGKDFWEEKIRKYKAAMLEIELKKATGELLSREGVERGRVARIMTIKRTLLALPTRMAPLLAMKEPREVEVTLYEALGEVIDEFAGVRNESLDKRRTSGVAEADEDNGK